MRMVSGRTSTWICLPEFSKSYFAKMFSALSHFIFNTSSLFSGHSQSDGARSSSWREKRLCFDLRSSELELGPGEQVIAAFYPIEDVKGNQDEVGLMRVTNLRLIWICCRKKRVNLSIGWRTVTLAYEQNLKDALCDTASNLFVLSKYDSTKYEFVFSKKGNQEGILRNLPSSFTHLDWTWYAQLKKFREEKASLISHLTLMYIDEPFEVVFKTWRAYKQTHLFRHCRSNLAQLSTPKTFPDPDKFHSDDLNMLPSEEVIDVVSSVTLESRNKHTDSGLLVLTNVRLVWVQDMYVKKNLSIPYLRVEAIKLKQSKKIVINPRDYLASSTHVDFLFETKEKARVCLQKIQELYNLHKLEPRFGPESCSDCISFMSHLRPVEELFVSIEPAFEGPLENFGPAVKLHARDNLLSSQKIDLDDGTKPIGQNGKHEDDVDRVESDLDKYRSKLTNYFNEQPLEHDNEVIYSTDLGLAIEKPANGASLKSIWKIEI